jgi:hypothetical protein
MDTRGILDALTSHALASGVFDVVAGHEPKHAPGNGLSIAFWVQSLGPARSQSGLQQTSGLLVVNARLYTSMTSDPPDAIDPNMVDAADVLMGAYSGDFELGAQVRNIDLLGDQGPGLSLLAGYLVIDNKALRVLTITIPMVINDVWSQNA